MFDLWSERRRRTQLRGAMIVVRYGDDMVVGFEQREEAEAFLQDVRRFNDFGLQLHSEKTRLLEFGRSAVARRKGA
ncbi:MAG: reverse transcriptase domain-containing protein, partial [Gammaproteobacteria bacterium]